MISFSFRFFDQLLCCNNESLRDWCNLVIPFYVTIDLSLYSGKIMDSTVLALGGRDDELTEKFHFFLLLLLSFYFPILFHVPFACFFPSLLVSVV
jgi:hypothetical protein